MITKQLILDTTAIAQFILDEKMDGLILTRYPENQKKNTEKLKPKIDQLKNKYGLAPHQILNNFLKQYIRSRHLEKNITSDGKQFYTQVVNSYTWACIFNSDTSNLISAHSNSSQYPQLYILINNAEILFGFCYGAHLKESDPKIQSIIQNDGILQNIFTVLQKDKNLNVYKETSNSGLNILTINNVEDLRKNWSREIQLLKRFWKDDVPEDIDDIITDTFNELLDLFTSSSFLKIDTDTKSRNYWQIAPNTDAKDWDLCVKKGIIAIYFKEYLQNPTVEILNYSRDQLIDLCQKNNPEATKGQITSNVELIWNFIHDVKIDDYILANRGKNQALAWGIITSAPKISTDNDEFTFYREVNWKNTTLNRNLDSEQGKNFFRTIYRMTKEHFDSIINSPINYWAVLPLSYTLGRLDVWQKWKSLGIVNIMWKNLAENLGNKLLNFSSYEEYESEYRKIYPFTQADMVWNFIYEMKEGDVILVSRGNKTILGRGIIKSPAKIFDKSRIDSTNQDILTDMLIHREVTWEEFTPEIAIPQEIKRKFSRSVRALDKSDYDKIFGGVSELEKRPPAKPYPFKQVILYGPPGTGKTYGTIIIAHEIIFGKIDPTITFETLVEKLQDMDEQRNEMDISKLSWLEAIVLAFDELQKDTVQVDDIKNSKIIQDFSSFKNNHSISNTIWYILQTESKIESELVKSKNKSGRELFDKDTESNWYLTEKGKVYQQSLIEDLKDITQNSDAQFKFITFHESFSYEDFVEGIRPTLDDTEESQIVYKVKDGIFKEICKKASLDPYHNYVLIIDEINRGNISKIFGELITLLEDNKRAGEKEAITVRLPYSNQDFSVPNNVYIIGTMNSTDKSIALVDVVLRRRFHFERLNVNYDLIQNEEAMKFLKGLNGSICALKNPDFEIGHSYFMNIPKIDVGNQELKKIFKTKILPLIEEYFFNDWEALATILSPDSIQIEKRKKLVWDEDSGEFKKESEEFGRISGRCIDYKKDIFENTRKNLENQQKAQEINVKWRT